MSLRESNNPQKGGGIQGQKEVVPMILEFLAAILGEDIPVFNLSLV